MALDIVESSQIKSAWSIKRSAWIAIVCLILGISVFIISYIGMVKNTGIGSFNHPILDWMITHRNSQITSIMQLITELANPINFIIIISIIDILWRSIKREIWRPVLLIGSAGAAAILSTIIKSITINSRPITDNMIAPFETDYSFPSGHTIIVVTFLLVLGYMICSRNSNLARIIIWEIIVVVGFVLIATSRLYLGYHWLTDVTASLGLGLIILGASIFVDIIISKYIKN
ncbi:hypothetical protein COV88_03295 [Candidatus Saccharibacteria bacterium CG11_big_fil_rev_8_21_14_0_20_41_19]|nr:MAG: hypothetical protein AUK57_01325 [Candidatus Saccharibacteria bacterium CG2_30_41_52]PIQ70623.1 MAG: hypothetical protein COV88_03295 [Candidatus Saccharibacteria bacterium CG11_big_fil_rev_8_21_14_0_20_41_19]PIZ60558.1 MAG: hypothetical protein COY18_01130 [Candidatus Saccharibacteria bacterium CG_4_10_14_0_2_um_filter_41_11]PJC29828.1 MAG: hypothetical protein CO052_01265 [Candidatus Saccharibacteria bacterium CG_4_9_14_0_2_um_filter_41_9]PJE66179.1 MAG: hypothetical protein COU92_015